MATAIGGFNPRVDQTWRYALDESSIAEWAGIWTVLHFNCQWAEAVEKDLARRDVPVWIPRRLVWRMQGGRRRRISEVMFRGYGFCAMPSLDSWDDVRRAKGIVGLLVVNNQERLRRELASLQIALANQPTLDAYPQLIPGIPVRVTAGPYVGMEGYVEDRLKRDRVVLRLTEINYSAPVEMDAAIVEIIE